MTILTDVPARRLAFRGHDDPALPTGIWWGTGVVVGDASGGTNQVRVLLKAEGAAVSGEMWNLEHVMAFISDAASFVSFVTAVGLSPSRDAPGVDALYRFQSLSVGSGLGNSALSEVIPRMPIFLGSVRGGADTLAAVAYGTNNLTVSDSLSVSMMGYVWDPRSMLTEGGPQRPPRALFGSG